MFHGRNNIILEGVGVRVRCKDEEVERNMVFLSYFCKCPKDLWRLLNMTKNQQLIRRYNLVTANEWTIFMLESRVKCSLLLFINLNYY